MLNEKQRDHIIELANSEPDPGVRRLLQIFVSMHASIKPKDTDQFMTDVSVDLMDIGIDCHRKGHQLQAAIITFIAGAVMTQTLSEKVNALISMLQVDFIAQSIANQFSDMFGASVQKKKRKKKSEGGDASGKNNPMS